MPGKYDKNRPLSWISRAKKSISSIFSRSSRSRPASSPAHSDLPVDNPGRVDAPSPHADTHLAPAPVSRHTSVSAPSIANPLPVQPPSTDHPTHHLEDPASQNRSSTHLAPSSAPPVLQGQASTSQGPTYARGPFSGAHNFAITNSVLNDYSTTADNFMKEVLQETIIGAEFDSSARDPPPRCHPGTRLAIIQRCIDFIIRCQDEGKLRWVVGPAGVGKSAVMQMVTEQAPDGVIFASIFLSINGRTDGSKVILTIAYQLAVKCAPYRQFIRDQITLDPSLVRKSLSVQFNKFIVEPFIRQRLFEPSCRFLIVIDGLDECNSPSTQELLLGLMTNFCITYPTSPLAWIVASRPEPHITSFFDQADVKGAYTKEEMVVDSDEACEDVQRYLRDELGKIKLKYPTLKHKREWPLEHEFTEIASSAGGLFAYAATVIRYIGDPHCRDPAAQLRRVLEVIHAGTKDHLSEEHPMAHLDALYKRILSCIPDNVMVNARKLLLVLSGHYWRNANFRMLCNMLGLTEDEAYGAICHLYAVMKIPDPDKADDERLEYYHKSFEDFLFDSKRSGFSDNFKDEARQLRVQTSLRILEEVPYDSDAVAGGQDIELDDWGRVKGCCDNVSLSWPGDERFRMTDEELQIEFYRATMSFACHEFSPEESSHGNISFFHALTTRFTELNQAFRTYQVLAFAFDTFRDELTKLGKLKQVPLRALDYAAVCGWIELRFTSPIGTDIGISDAWNSSCDHRKWEIDNLQQRRGWSTDFRRYYRDATKSEDGEDAEGGGDTDGGEDREDVKDPKDDEDAEDGEDADIPRFHILTLQKPHQNLPKGAHYGECIHCSRRFARHFMNNPDQLATVFVDATQMSYVELTLVDPDDGVSEWRYLFGHSGPPTGIDA